MATLPIMLAMDADRDMRPYVNVYAATDAGLAFGMILSMN